MTIRIASALVALGVAATSAIAEGLPSAVVCTFTTGTASTHIEGGFKQTPASPITFELVGIDLDKQAGGMVARPGASPAPLRIVRALNANHFIEVLTEGFLTLTTVFDKDEKTGLYPAVHSRHVGVFGQAVVAQYTGDCRAK